MAIFNSFTQRHQIAQLRPRLYRIALALCNQVDLAEDLTQDALGKALKNLSSVRDHQKLDSWVFSILTNCYRDYLRKLKPEECFDESKVSTHSSADISVEQKQAADNIHNAISKLPDNHKTVLLLVDLEEFSYAEVATILDIPVGTVMSRLNRARNRLKEIHIRQDQHFAPVKKLERIK